MLRELWGHRGKVTRPKSHPLAHRAAATLQPAHLFLPSCSGRGLHALGHGPHCPFQPWWLLEKVVAFPLGDCTSRGTGHFCASASNPAPPNVISIIFEQRKTLSRTIHSEWGEGRPRPLKVWSGCSWGLLGCSEQGDGPLSLGHPWGVWTEKPAVWAFRFHSGGGTERGGEVVGSTGRSGRTPFSYRGPDSDDCDLGQILWDPVPHSPHS